MANDGRQDSIRDRETNGVERLDHGDDDEIVESSSATASSGDVETSTSRSAVDSSSRSESSGSSSASGSGSGSRSRISLADRLHEILVGNGDGDLLLQQSDRESNFLQWLQALDMQVVGACRADERLKPLLKVNASSGVAEDRLLAHLSQHFEATEVGLLARCLCIPLVFIRVGKVTRQGTLLCPTSSRGNLNLMLLPSSDLRITFVGDDGKIERLATLNNSSECSAVAIEEISADKSGRCFLINVPGGEVFHFWCSEKSKLLGVELLSKMKDLLKRKPTLAELTGISESRLECFATHLCAYLIGSNASTAQASAVVLPTLALDIRSDIYERGLSTQSSSTSGKPLRSRHYGGQALKTQTVYQGSLSPRSSSFKEGLPRTFSSLRSSSREKLKRRGDIQLSSADSHDAAAASLKSDSAPNHPDKGKNLDAVGSGLASPMSFLESLEKFAVPPILSATSQHPPVSSRFSPYYCWCPPCSLPSTMPTQFPVSLPEPLSLPPISSLLPATRTASLLTQASPFNPSDTPVDFPALLPDPLLHLPFSKQSSQQVPTFTPLICDPIVHIPVIDVCSSGQGYFVSAGPAIATSIAPLHAKLVSPLIPEGESLVEKGARETLRLLISSSNQSTTQLMDVLPAVLDNDDERQGILVAGSRGLYSGTSDVNSIAKSIASIGLVTLSESSLRCGNMKTCVNNGASGACQEESCSELEGTDLGAHDPTSLRRKEVKD
ncbi:hypothetical protein Ancab_034419 [Ancistrocladus abbreviatus]